jgi:hypothetical protein
MLDSGDVALTGPCGRATRFLNLRGKEHRR